MPNVVAQMPDVEAQMPGVEAQMPVEAQLPHVAASVAPQSPNTNKRVSNGCNC